MKLDKLTPGELYVYEELMGTAACINSDLYTVKTQVDDYVAVGSALASRVDCIETTYYDSSYQITEELGYVRDAVEKLRLVLVDMNDRISRLEQHEGWADDGDLSLLLG